MKPAAHDNSPAGSGLLFPGPTDGWEYWEGTAPEPKRLNAEDARALRHVEWAALPAATVGNFVMPTPTTDAAMLRQAAYLSAERLRLKKEHTQPALGWWPAGATGHSGDSALVEILDESSPEAVINTTARHHAASPHLLPLPENGYTLWREHGRLVLAVTRAGGLTYYATFPAPENAEILRHELGALKHQLEFRGLSPRQDIHNSNWEALPEPVAKALNVLPGNWESGPRPPPRPAGAAGGEIIPVLVAEERHTTARRRRTRRLLFGVVVVYVATLVIWLGVLGQRKAANRALEQSLAQTATEVAQLQATAQDWDLLLPALDNRYYPLTLMQEVYETMPANREIRLDSFSLKDDTIEVHGRAINVDQVFRFHRQLANQPDLQRFQWSLDNPAIQPDGGATFRLIGRP